MHPETDQLPQDDFERGFASQAFQKWLQMRLREGIFSQDELLRIVFPEWGDVPIRDPEELID
jgi:hypothetical protein